MCAIQIGGVSMIIHYFYIYLTTNCCLGIVTCYKLNCSCCLVMDMFFFEWTEMHDFYHVFLFSFHQYCS